MFTMQWYKDGKWQGMVGKVGKVADVTYLLDKELLN